MRNPDQTIQFIADRGDAHLRLDQVLVRRIREISRMSRSLAQQWIEAGAVTVNGRVAPRPSIGVREGASVEILLPSSAVRRSRPEPEAAAMDVLYEDDHLMVVNKPAGIVVHPSYKQLSGTLLNAVLWRVRDRSGAQPGIVTRLDKDTSGLVIIALSAQVHAAMQRESAAGRVRKEYLALVRGVPRPATGRIMLALARDPEDRRRVIATSTGAPSETRYEVLAAEGEPASVERGPDGPPELEPISLVRCELVTGRTHQIRVHLATSGWPIVGDRLYGEADELIGRQALHAWRASFQHPATQQPLQIDAPLPRDMQHRARWPARVSGQENR